VATSDDMEDGTPDIKGGANSETVAAEQLRAFVERIERRNVTKREVADDIRGIYAEAKGNGFDTKVLRAVVRLREQDANDRAEQRALTELYLHALGMD
jgi:uncharacterized protein (UPF0335 family)